MPVDQVRKAEIIDRIKSKKRIYQCSGCKQGFTALVSLNCNCGGDILPLKEANQRG